MIRLFTIAVLFVVCSAWHVVSLEKATSEHGSLPVAESQDVVAPSPFIKITSLEFDGLASDFLYLKAMVFMGQASKRTERPQVKTWEWQRLYNELKAATDLDPYFLDPYYFASANLTWGGHLYRETNALLEKGSKYRNWDWMPPFYIGFNYFYFLHDYGQASKFLMEASKRPGADPIFASLATRLAYKGHRTENAILFLRRMLISTKDETIRKEFEKRLEALKEILMLEKGVASFQSLFNTRPFTLRELIWFGIIDRFPQDPYGGVFYLDKDGSVKTTSDLR